MYNSPSPNSVTDSDYYETWDSDISLDDIDTTTTVVVMHPYYNTSGNYINNIPLNSIAISEYDNNYNGDDESSVPESAAEKRILDLQEELEKLKSQIASIIVGRYL